jgi:hypothetical protein
MKVLALDPSSTCVGYALLAGDKTLLAAGVIKPDKASAPSYERICSLRRDLRTLLDELEPDTILVEWTKGKVGHRRHLGQGAGLAVYGAGVGAIAAEADNWGQRRQPPVPVVAVLENDWTRGVPKDVRRKVIEQQYTQYKSAMDPGGDMADAIGLAGFWLQQSLFLP